MRNQPMPACLCSFSPQIEIIIVIIPTTKTIPRIIPVSSVTITTKPTNDHRDSFAMLTLFSHGFRIFSDLTVALIENTSQTHFIDEKIKILKNSATCP